MIAKIFNTGLANVLITEHRCCCSAGVESWQLPVLPDLTPLGGESQRNPGGAEKEMTKALGKIGQQLLTNSK